MWIYTWVGTIFVVGVFVMLGKITSLVETVIKRMDAVEERFGSDWKLISAELWISAYKREGGLICYAEKRFPAPQSALNMPATGDWLIFSSNGRTYRGEVVGREVRYGAEDCTKLEGYERAHVYTWWFESMSFAMMRKAGTASLQCRAKRYFCRLQMRTRLLRPSLQIGSYALSRSSACPSEVLFAGNG